MAAPSGDISNIEQVWDVVLKQLKDLSSATVQKNLELAERVFDLEEELSVWKQARSATLDTAERDKRVYDDQLAILKRRIASLEAIQDQDSMILCVIDGDMNIFNESFFSQGQEGGRLAAQQLTKGIAEYLIKENVQPRGRFSFWVSVYLNRKSLQETLVACDICTAPDFEAFLLGFSQASPRFLLVDVVNGKEAADPKIKEYLQTYIRFPQTLRVFFAGGPGTSYLTTLKALGNELLLEKLIILKGHEDVAMELSSLRLPTLNIDGLFRGHKPASISRPSPPTAAPIATDDFALSPIKEFQSQPISPIHTPSGDVRFIDTKLPLHKREMHSETHGRCYVLMSKPESPPPCNEYYLMTCNKGASCKYAHDYILTPEQLSTLASNAKKAPCNFLRHGLQCPYGDRCCWGHVCPRGASCFHYSKGKCWFKGVDMHGSPQSGKISMPE